MSDLTIEVREARLEEIFDLRHRVLRPGFSVADAQYEEDQLATTRHVGAFANGRAVGCATLLLNEWDGEPAWQLRGMGIEKTHRGSGVGSRVLEVVERVAVSDGPSLLWCNARVLAVRFYERVGWRVMSGEFDVPTVGPHVKMMKRLP